MWHGPPRGNRAIRIGRPEVPPGRLTSVRGDMRKLLGGFSLMYLIDGCALARARFKVKFLRTTGVVSWRQLGLSCTGYRTASARGSQEASAIAVDPGASLRGSEARQEAPVVPERVPLALGLVLGGGCTNSRRTLKFESG